jgi:hypothetical protein
MSRNQCLLRYGQVWVDILGDQILGPVVLPNGLTGAVYHCFFVNDLSLHSESDWDFFAHVREYYTPLKPVTRH